MKVLLCILPPVAPDYPPLGAAVLAGALRSSGHECVILDTNIMLYRRFPEEQWRWSDSGWNSWGAPERYHNWIEYVGAILVQAIVQEGVTGVALSASSAALPFARESVRALIERFSSLPVIIGGAGFFHDEDIAAFPVEGNITICKGEGDEALVGWADRLGEAGRVEPVLEARIRHLGTLAVPDFSGFAHEQYTRSGVFPAETSRGCLNHCAFCDDAQMWGRYRIKSPEKVRADLRGLPDTTCHVSFCDSLLNPTPRRMLAISEVVAPYNLTWDGMLQCRGVDATIAKSMYVSGCRDVFLGVESFNPVLLRHLNKASTAEHAEKAIRVLHQEGINVSMGLIIAGPPFQTRAEFELDLKKLEYLSNFITSVAVNPLCIPKGTPLWDMGKRLGMNFPQKNPWQSWHAGDVGPDVRFRWTMEAVVRLYDLGLYRTESKERVLSLLEQLIDSFENTRSNW